MKEEYVKIKVIPKASKSEIVGMEGDYLKVRIKAVPEKGKANEALEKFLSKEWNARVEVVKGKTGRLKTVFVQEKRKKQNR